MLDMRKLSPSGQERATDSTRQGARGSGRPTLPAIPSPDGVAMIVRMEALFPGMLAEPATLLDERARPDFRDVFGALAMRSTDIAVAVTRVRLSTVDLSERELGSLEHFRVLIAEMSALRLDAEARALQADAKRAPNAETLRKLLEAGTLEVRSSPLAGWSPDFTVFAGPGGPTAVLLGFHAFERPYPHRGPALAALHGPEAARLAARRHEEIWERAHDVGPAVWSILSKARSRARSRALVNGGSTRAAGG
jgi:hypothetical protein